MSCYLGVVPHPYYAVSGEEGKFSLNRLPAGEFLIEAWHEKFGSQVQRVLLEDGESKSLTFTFSAP
jgi:hypothetical protein